MSFRNKTLCAVLGKYSTIQLQQYFDRNNVFHLVSYNNISARDTQKQNFYDYINHNLVS